MKTEIEKMEISSQEQENLDEMSNLIMSSVDTISDGKYEISREIGRGGMGIVYEAYHKYTHQRVAIKVIPAGTVDPIQLKRFQKEIEAYSLLSHPNVITIYESGIYHKYPYIVMEYIEGVDICTYVKKHNATDWKLCAKLIYETALGLEYIHSKKMVHRDIKPSNIIIKPDGCPVIIDLGLVKFDRTQSYNLTQNKEIIGTLEYMPIEQARGEKSHIDARTDVYSLGLVLYELLTGQRAYNSENIMELCYNIMFYTPPLPRKINPEIPEVLETITLHAIEKQRAKRYANMKEFADALKEYLDSTTRLDDTTTTVILLLNDTTTTLNLEDVYYKKRLLWQQSRNKIVTLVLKCYVKTQYRLGCMYYKEKNYAKAVYWYEKFSNQYLASTVGNIAKAQYRLGNMYYEGQGVNKNYEKAVYWYEKSAYQGYVTAQFILGFMYFYGKEIQQDYQKAVYWYKKASNQGFSSAQNNLGLMYSSGQGVTQNYAKAFVLFEKAAYQGHASAQYNLANMYYEGQGVSQNYKMAFYWYEISAYQGHASAQYNLGNMYYEGRGEQQDYQKAIYWYKKASNQGYKKAKDKLKEL